MSIQMIGIDHNKASLDVRALFSLTKTQMEDALSVLYQVPQINGCLILSTCNRMEVWADMEEAQEGFLYEKICQIKQVNKDMFKEAFICRQDEEAIRHLFYLTSGLKSRIIGEDQILTQVREALDFARDQQATNQVLEVLFRMAVTAAKRVKTEITFPKASMGAIEQALTMLQNEGQRIEGSRCMVIGNGQMGKMAATALKKAGADVFVTVRQYRHGRVEVPDGCESIDYSKRQEYLSKCDIVISATTSPHYTLTKEFLKEADICKPLNLIDLAVPRDIEVSARELLDVYLYDIDDFKSDDLELSEARNEAQALLEEQITEFGEWMAGLTVMPRILMVNSLMVNDLELRLKKVIKKLPMEEEEQQKLSGQIHKAAQKTANKILFNLKESLDEETFKTCLDALENVYPMSWKER